MSNTIELEFYILIGIYITVFLLITLTVLHSLLLKIVVQFILKNKGTLTPKDVENIILPVKIEISQVTKDTNELKKLINLSKTRELQAEMNEMFLDVINQIKKTKNNEG